MWQCYLPKLRIIEGAGTDFPYRAKVSHKKFANALRQIVLEINYANFKDVVAVEQSLGRSMVYSRVWGVLRAGEGGRSNPIK